MRRPGLSLAACVIFVMSASACVEENPIAQTWRNRSVKGDYVYAGRGTTATVPWAFDAVLKLDGKGKYQLDVDVRVKEDGDKDTDYGTYRVEDGRVFLDDSKHGEDHELLVRGDSLIADTGWKGSLALRLIGVPKPVFVKK